jgi:poly(3-hydroxybutyrate) depolymerase
MAGRFVLMVLALALGAAADTLHMKSGSKMEGRVVAEKDGVVELKFPGGGQATVDAGEIEWIELSDKAAAIAEFDRRCKGADADGLMRVAGWARFHGMPDEAAMALRNALKKDPEHAGAHEALGHRRVDGKWLTEDEWQAASGKVKVGGKWVTPEEKAALEAGRKEPAKEEVKKPAGDKEAARAFGEALRLVAAYVWGEGKVREDARKAVEARGVLDRALTKEQAKALLDVLASGNPYLTDKTNSGVLDVPTGTDGETTKANFQLPPGYKPGKDKPPGLVIALHGGPQPDYKSAIRIAAEEFTYFNGPAAKHKLICASPGWIGDPTRVVFETVEAVAKRWNVDRSRIWMVGHSAGGVASFMVGPPWADRFAGIAPFVCGMEHGDRLKNAWNLPVYHVLGRKDNAFFLETGRKNSEALRVIGGPLQVVEKDGGHDVFPDECDKSMEWLVARPRNFWSKDVRWTPDSARTEGGLFWVDPRAEGASGAFTAKVEGNEIKLTGDLPGELVLSDALVDLDKPVKVTAEGEVLFEGAVPRAMRTALEWVEKTRDFSAVPVARVELKR